MASGVIDRGDKVEVQSQNGSSIDTDVLVGADLAQLSCLLIDVNVETGLEQTQRRGGAANNRRGAQGTRGTGDRARANGSRSR